MPSLQTDPDPAGLAALDAPCFATAPGDPAWDAAAYAGLCANPAVHAWLLRDDDGVAVGLLLFQRAGDEAEVYRIGVLPQRRGQGLAAGLLERLLAWARAERVTRIHLEVRAGNAAARRLYERAGFREAGCRPAYYRDPSEDAVRYAWEAGAAAGGAAAHP